MTVLLQVLSSYINPSGEDDEEDVINNVLPPTFPHLLANSSLLSALSSYLRNDSGNVKYLCFDLRVVFAFLFFFSSIRHGAAYSPVQSSFGTFEGDGP